MITVANTKITELASNPSVTGDDLLLIVNDPGGTPTSNKVTVNDLFDGRTSNLTEADGVADGDFYVYDAATGGTSTVSPPVGVPGRDGTNGTDGAPGRDGVDGAPGRDGTNGVDGAPGTNGRNGTDGTNGTNGVDGQPGRDGTNGVDGAPGRDGVDGQPGTNGTNGTNGRNPGIEYVFNANTTSTTLSSIAEIALNDADPTLATRFRISAYDAEIHNDAPWIDQWDDSTSDHKGVILVTRNSDRDKLFYNVWERTATTGVAEFRVTYLGGEMTPALVGNQTLGIEFFRTGDKGADGSSGTSTSNTTYYATLSDRPATASNGNVAIVGDAGGGTSAHYYWARGAWQDGSTGLDGAAGASVAAPYVLDGARSVPSSTTNIDGRFYVSHSTLSAITTIWIANRDTNGFDRRTWFAQKFNSTSSPRGILDVEVYNPNTNVLTGEVGFPIGTAMTTGARYITLTIPTGATISASNANALSGAGSTLALFGTPKGDKGEQGDPGQNGTNGTDGAPGRDGTNGTNGVDGAPGRDGTNGTNGTDGTNGVNGQPGRDGTNGTNGVDGQPGRDGTNGRDGPGRFEYRMDMVDGVADIITPPANGDITFVDLQAPLDVTTATSVKISNFDRNGVNRRAEILAAIGANGGSVLLSDGTNSVSFTASLFPITLTTTTHLFFISTGITITGSQPADNANLATSIQPIGATGAAGTDGTNGTDGITPGSSDWTYDVSVAGGSDTTKIAAIGAGEFVMRTPSLTNTNNAIFINNTSSDGDQEDLLDQWSNGSVLTVQWSTGLTNFTIDSKNSISTTGATGVTVLELTYLSGRNATITGSATISAAIRGPAGSDDLTAVNGRINTTGNGNDITTSGVGSDIVAHRGNLGAGTSGQAKSAAEGNATVNGYLKVGQFSDADVASTSSGVNSGSVSEATFFYRATANKLQFHNGTTHETVVSTATALANNQVVGTDATGNVIGIDRSTLGGGTPAQGGPRQPIQLSISSGLGVNSTVTVPVGDTLNDYEVLVLDGITVTLPDLTLPQNQRSSFRYETNETDTTETGIIVDINTAVATSRSIRARQYNGPLNGGVGNISYRQVQTAFGLKKRAAGTVSELITGTILGSRLWGTNSSGAFAQIDPATLRSDPVSYRRIAAESSNPDVNVTFDTASQEITFRPAFNHQPINIDTGISGQYNVVAEKSGGLQRDALMENFVGDATESPTGSVMTLINRGSNASTRVYGYRPAPAGGGSSGSNVVIRGNQSFTGTVPTPSSAFVVQLPTGDTLGDYLEISVELRIPLQIGSDTVDTAYIVESINIFQMITSNQSRVIVPLAKSAGGGGLGISLNPNSMTANTNSFNIDVVQTDVTRVPTNYGRLPFQVGVITGRKF